MDTDGYIYLIDRKKDMIVSGGMNIYSTEIENCINAHPAIEQSVVVGIPDETWGESVHAEVILKKSASLSAPALIEHCKKRLSRYKAPKSVSFVENLPLSAVGKLLRREVRKKYWNQKKRGIN
jgi:fatty-acyl-CoA synthase